MIPESVEAGRRPRPLAPLLAAAAALAVAGVLWRLGSESASVGGERLAPAGAAREAAGLEGLPTPRALDWRVAVRVDPPEAGEGDLVTVTAVVPSRVTEVAVRLPGESGWRPMEPGGDSWNGDYGLWRLSFRLGAVPPGISHVVVRATASGESRDAEAILTIR